ncbi:Z-ring formation inhibitor MciZ [Gorillibacterium timonense]|uniref:Z-ring formation inhibitor MciZ n=1 Tax=Gorillibacterium timonense TaxID=1689269 RepID=UPI000D527A80|nr:Z-ring formation inhibitor MciZ [Gorillibacterium timonense]
MKVYLSDGGFRMVGKAWEVRSKLKEFSRSTDSDVPVTSLLPKSEKEKKTKKNR